MNTASLNSTIEQGGHVFESQLYSLISLEKPPGCNKVSIHLNLLFGGFICVYFAYFRGKHWGLIWVNIRPYFCMYLTLMPFPSMLSGKIFNQAYQWLGVSLFKGY